MAEHRRMSDREVTGVAANEDGKRKDREPARETDGDIIPGVRASDIEPYTGLRYLSKLFRVMAVIIVLLLVAEVVTGLSTIGSAGGAGRASTPRQTYHITAGSQKLGGTTGAIPPSTTRPATAGSVGTTP